MSRAIETAAAGSDNNSNFTLQFEPFHSWTTVGVEGRPVASQLAWEIGAFVGRHGAAVGPDGKPMSGEKWTETIARHADARPRWSMGIIRQSVDPVDVDAVSEPIVGLVVTERRLLRRCLKVVEHFIDPRLRDNEQLLALLGKSGIQLPVQRS